MAIDTTESITHKVSLWLWNEEPTYRHWTARADELCEEYENDAPYDLRHTGGKVSALAREMEDYYLEEQPKIPTSLYSDLLRTALAFVDWLEIARQFCESRSDNQEKGQ